MVGEKVEQRDESGDESRAGTERGKSEFPGFQAKQPSPVVGVRALILGIGDHEFDPRSPFVIIGVTQMGSASRRGKRRHP
jgi:hypothetical protein